MATKVLESNALSVFCESVAMMLSAGIQTDEAVYLLGENMQDSDFKDTCNAVYRNLIDGKSLAESMRASGAFPRHAEEMVETGEFSGRLENVLLSLSQYYAEEDRIFSKIKSAIAYPAALLAIMTVILLFAVVVLLPVFIGAYENLSGSLTAGSFAYINVSLIIGWVALIIMLVCTILVLIGMLMSRTQNGRTRLIRLFERMPFTRDPLERLALGRFTSALAVYTASGVDSETSMKESAATVDHVALKAKLDTAYDEMISPHKMKSLVQAIYDNDIFDPIYARMLVVGTRSGTLESVLTHLSDSFVDDSIIEIDGVIDSVEPTLAAFLTISVGATLIAVMLPLIGIMGTIG